MVLVRRARPEDAEAIQALGLADPAFQVSEKIPFYEKKELVEWANSPADNLLFVAESEGRLSGFFFCKVMSSHWAMLDNFYVVPQARGTRTAQRLRMALLQELRARGTCYLSILVALEDEALAKQMARHGFLLSRHYGWMERFLNWDN